MPKQAQPKVLLAFDFGMRRIGVAVGQSLTNSATPLATLPAKDGIPSWETIKNLIETWQADALIVGIPYNMDGSEQDITKAARKFLRRLHRYHLPTYEVDERLTTVEARNQLYAKNLRAADIKNVDSFAAKLILESWLLQQDL